MKTQRNPETEPASIDSPYLERLAWWTQLEDYEERLAELREEQRSELRAQFETLQRELLAEVDAETTQQAEALRAATALRVRAFLDAVEATGRRFEASEQELERFAERLTQRATRQAAGKQHAVDSTQRLEQRVRRLERDQRRLLSWGAALLAVMALACGVALWSAFGPGWSWVGSDAGAASATSAGTPGTDDDGGFEFRLAAAGALQHPTQLNAWVERSFQAIVAPCLTSQAASTCRRGLAAQTLQLPLIEQAYADQLAAVEPDLPALRDVLVQAVLVDAGEDVAIDGQPGAQTAAAIARRGVTVEDLVDPLRRDTSWDWSAIAALFGRVQIAPQGRWVDNATTAPFGLQRWTLEARPEGVTSDAAVEQVSRLIGSHLSGQDQLLELAAFDQLDAAARQRLQTAFERQHPAQSGVED